MTTNSKGLAAALTVGVFFTGVAWSEWRTVFRQRTEIARLERQAAGIEREIRELHAQRTADLQAFQAARDQVAAAAAPSALESRVRSVFARVDSLKERMARSPGQRIPELQLLTADDWFDSAQQNSHLETDDDFRVALGGLRNKAMNHFLGQLQGALNSYLKSSQGQLPGDVSQLAPFFASPVDAAALQRYEMLKTGVAGNATHGAIGEKASAVVDPDFDEMIKIGTDGWQTEPAYDTKPLHDALNAFNTANPGQAEPTPDLLATYFKDPAQAARFLEREKANERERAP